MRVRPLALVWSPLAIADVVRVNSAPPPMDDVLALWKGTRYGSGQRCRGVAADCIGFVFGAIDDLDGRARAQAPSMPADIALHDQGTAGEALRALRALYEPVEVLRAPEAGPLRVQPFDILVVGPAGAGPSHVMLVGTAPGHLWHCTPGAGVHRGGWALGTGYETLHGAFRIGDRWRWLR